MDLIGNSTWDLPACTIVPIILTVNYSNCIISNECMIVNNEMGRMSKEVIVA
jgi:hypothetical protein